MFIRISGDVFKAELGKLMEGSSTRVNFRLRDNKRLDLQTFGLVIKDLFVTNLILANPDTGNETDNITVTLDNTIKLIDSKEDVYISVHGDVAEIKQGSFTYNAVRDPEIRIDSGVEDVVMDERYDPIAVVNYITSTKALDDVARSLSKAISGIDIYRGEAYMGYSNIIYVNKIDLPDMSLPGEVARHMANAIVGSRSNDCYFDGDRNIAYFKVDRNEFVTVTTSHVNHTLADIVQELEVRFKSIATVDISKYKTTMETIYKTHKNIQIELAVCSDNGIRIDVKTPKLQFSVGSESKQLCCMRMTIAEMIAIAKLYGNSNNVEILRGENLLCFQQKSLGKKLIVIGMLY